MPPPLKPFSQTLGEKSDTESTIRTSSFYSILSFNLKTQRGVKNLETVQFYTLKLTNERQLTHWLRSYHSQAVDQVHLKL